MWPFKKRNRWAGVDFLTLIPEQAATVAEVEPGATEESVVLLMPRFQGTLFESWLQPLVRRDKRTIRVPLEARGSFLWRHIDGRSTAADLVAAFVDAFPEDGSDAERRVCQYLYSLEQNRFIRFANLPDGRSQ